MEQPIRPVSLSEAARLFAPLEGGPSRAKLTRDSSAGMLDACAARGNRRTLYRFADLCKFYRVDPEVKRGGRASPAATGQAQELPPGLVPMLERMQQQIDQLAAAVAQIGRDSRDLLEVRRTLMLKYDSDAGHLRQRLDAAEARLQTESALQALTREVTAVRQVAGRTLDLMQQGPGPT